MLPGLMEALQILKSYWKSERMDFTDHWVAKDADYTIEGEVTKQAVEELLSRGTEAALEELRDLLDNIDVPVV